MPYRDWQVKRSPPWLREDDGGKLEAELGGAKDVLADRIRVGILARFPDFSPDDGLDAIGADRQLPRAPGEDPEVYAARLKAAWDAWPYAGSHFGMLTQLAIQGFAPAVIVQDNGRYTTLDGSGNLVVGWLGTSIIRHRPSWRFIDRDDFYSQFAIIFPGPLPGSIQPTAVATFTASAVATGTWPVPFDDTEYDVIMSRPQSTDGTIPTIGLDGTTKTAASIDVVASAPFTGVVHLLAFRRGSTNPLAGPSLSTINRLKATVNKWRPAKMTWRGAIAVIEGRLWGWPLAKWGDPGLKWGLSTSQVFGP